MASDGIQWGIYLCTCTVRSMGVTSVGDVGILTPTLFRWEGSTPTQMPYQRCVWWVSVCVFLMIRAEWATCRGLQLVSDSNYSSKASDRNDRRRKMGKTANSFEFFSKRESAVSVGTSQWPWWVNPSIDLIQNSYSNLLSVDLRCY